MTADCGVVRDATALQMAAETLADLAALADDLPARQIATLRGDQPAARLARDRRRRARPRRSRAARTPAPTCPYTDDAWLGRLVLRGEAAPRFVALPGLRRGAVTHERLRPAAVRRGRGRRGRARRGPRLARRPHHRSRASARTRPPTALFVARDEGVLAGTALVERDLPPARRRPSRSCGTCTTATPSRPAPRSAGSRARCARSSPVSGSRSTSCATARASRR